MKLWYNFLLSHDDLLLKIIYIIRQQQTSLLFNSKEAKPSHANIQASKILEKMYLNKTETHTPIKNVLIGSKNCYVCVENELLEIFAKL